MLSFFFFLLLRSHTLHYSLCDQFTPCFSLPRPPAGEYIAVEKVEVIQAKAESVESLWVYGNSTESSLVAVANPKENVIMAWAKENNKTEPFEQLITTPEVNKMVLEEIKAVAKQNKLNGFETVKAIHLDIEPFSVENGLLTPSFKKKRKDFQLHYQAKIDEMYASLKK